MCDQLIWRSPAVLQSGFINCSVDRLLLASNLFQLRLDGIQRSDIASRLMSSWTINRRWLRLSGMYASTIDESKGFGHDIVRAIGWGISHAFPFECRPFCALAKRDPDSPNACLLFHCLHGFSLFLAIAGTALWHLIREFQN
jgi:hypothetical protein